MTQNPKTSFKKSTIPWIGWIPEDWEVKKLKYISKIRSSNIDKNDDYEIETFVVNYNDVIRNPEITDSTVLDRTSCTESQLQSFSLKEDDLIVTKDSMDIRNIADISIVQSKKEGNLVCGYHLYIIRVNDGQISQKYLYYLLQNKGIKQYFLLESRGTTIIGLSNDSLANTVIPIPKDKFTQTAITKFLDQKTNEIKKFIENKKKLIELLKEQKQSIIHRAVTKGIDENAKMKESGVPWIGGIPENWEVRRLKTVTKSVQTGSTPKDPDSNPAFLNGTIPWYGPADFNDSLILPNETSKMINQSAMDAGELNFYPENTIFIIGIGATLGKIGLSRVKSSSNQQLNAIILSDKVIPEFGIYFLNATQEIIKNLANSATLPILNQTQTKNLFFFLPSISIQKSIVEHIEQETSQIDTAIAKIEKEITLIEEYRTSLVYQAVTGKITIS